MIAARLNGPSITACRFRPAIVGIIIHDVRTVIAQLALAQVKVPLNPVQAHALVARVLDLLGEGDRHLCTSISSYRVRFANPLVCGHHAILYVIIPGQAVAPPEGHGESKNEVGISAAAQIGVARDRLRVECL